MSLLHPLFFVEVKDVVGKNESHKKGNEHAWFHCIYVDVLLLVSLFAVNFTIFLFFGASFAAVVDVAWSHFADVGEEEEPHERESGEEIETIFRKHSEGIREKLLRRRMTNRLERAKHSSFLHNKRNAFSKGIVRKNRTNFWFPLLFLSTSFLSSFLSLFSPFSSLLPSLSSHFRLSLRCFTHFSCYRSLLDT